ncbi:MAG: hypothetical protein LBU62_00030 [Bacteroidales bacterium]|jgi:hypothetical protein|nr:hypothetical protein [Bacteroidales bacterium]
MKKQVIFLSILLICGSCEKVAESRYYFIVYNNSTQMISVYAAYIYPDTFLPVEKPKMLEIQPGKFDELY